ncbi:hypothetical protein POF50_028460 [Streptomyces sp. SL13]|uniref:Secreted protein n=1 Tax=Streptantibioticus silvisoli TaxID=2705255 RepID=A0AA90H351_9ACTN|nr:hypothetical protein [Streptantibioticus silvisoli]MDI5963077.1 hypothetical protein [Streptantibioticus silvisoli]MDI5973233.1 hypothetical protein [Streptantibioticus silvisoli]
MLRYPGRPAVHLAAVLAALVLLPSSAAVRAPVRLAQRATPGVVPLDTARDDGARCDLVRHGSDAVATCMNPDPEETRLQLHVSCVRWWDPATDTAPVYDGPAQWVTLSGRCWKEIRAAWLTRRTTP